MKTFKIPYNPWRLSISWGNLGLAFCLAASCVFFLRGIFFQGLMHPAPYVALLLLPGLFLSMRFNREVLFFAVLTFFSFCVVVIQSAAVGLNYGLVNEIGRFCFPFFACFVCLYYLNRQPHLFPYVLWICVFFSYHGYAV